MKILKKIFLISIGILFTFSGLVKINDPIGTAIKLKEYFNLFSSDFSSLFHYLVPFSLTFSVGLCIMEILVGIALITSLKIRYAVVALFCITLFFSFLTFYSAYFNKVTDCGCFGDAISLTPWQSFFKDIVLLIGAILLLRNRKKLSNKTSKTALSSIGISAILSFLIAYKGVYHLPFIDFRVYKRGNNIKKLMFPETPCRIIYVMKRNGKIFRLSTYPTDKSYTFIEKKILNKDECSPKITDYYISDTLGNNQTERSLYGKKVYIIIQELKSINPDQIRKINQLIERLPSDINPMIITSDSYRFDSFMQKNNLKLPYYLADATVLKTMIRSNPGIVYLDNGIIIDKWHINDIEESLIEN